MTALPASATIKFVNATIGYDRHPAVHHISTEIRAGSLSAIVGPNGAGKSTLLKAVVGLLRPMGGHIEIGGCARRRIAYLPQQADLERSFPLPVFDFVAMGLWHRRGPFGGFRRADDIAVAEALGTVGLAGFERRTLNTLSGGQMQRVLFARLSLQDSPLILLDEPFNAIDDRTVEDLMAFVLRWRDEGRTVLAVLHDLADVRTYFPETLLIARRLVAHGPTRDVLTPGNLSQARHMTEAWIDAAPYCDDHHTHAA
ncbi:metal ABC transporter ATP-binding protein [Oryzibacter oryziterrae]|uniref:metal ABC transporter ATP-binding protein n=1 Tax=Oryzibacter oryziterrae TaxID=2766474 RepID=UPI001F378313|nr:ABC transporter ATP-binding protein [Oryzibacter oryziterrae]